MSHVVLVRHGQGYHNLKVDGKSQLHVFDARLTERGEGEAAVALDSLPHEFHPDVILVSPLTRTMQTAHIAVRSYAARFPDRNLPQLMACSAAREGNNHNPCNHRSKKSELQQMFPDVDWSDVQTEEDVTGLDADPYIKEEISKTRNRARLLLSILEDKNASKILLFAHGGIIRCLFSVVIGLGYDHSVHEIGTGGLAELFLKERPNGTRFWSIGANTAIKVSEVIP